MASAGRTGPFRTVGLFNRQCRSQMIRYWSCRPPDTELRLRLRDLANERKRFGYRRLFVLLRQAGEASGINLIYRLYREEGLTVRKRRARRRAVGARVRSSSRPPNARWSLDFVHDQFACGWWLRILMPGGDPRHLDLGTSGGARTDYADRTARQAGNDRLGQGQRVSRAHRSSRPPELAC
jgi:HTH-like domain